MVRVNHLENKKCWVEYAVDVGEIRGREIKPSSKKPIFYSRTKRGISKAWGELERRFDEETTMAEAVNILEEKGVRCERGSG